MAKREPTALGAYIFAGGFSVGVRKHFRLLAHFEEGMYGVETAQHNLPELRGKVYTDPKTWPISEYAGAVDFLFANPPCAPWSVCSAGRKIPWRLDPRTGCAQRVFDLLGKIQPSVWAWESVRPAFSKGREMVDEMVKQAHRMGYHATALMVEGTRHGVPQKRPRFFLVLSKYELPWSPTRVRGVPTVGDAFAKKFASHTITKEGSKFFMRLVKKTKPGQRTAALFNQLYPERVAEGERTGEWVRGRPSFQNIRLEADKPSCVLTGGAKQIHPTEDRFITVEESGALCGYPRGFRFLGSVGKQYQQVAQAVMPPVGEYIARMARAGIDARKKVRETKFERVEIFTDHVDREPLVVGQVPITKTILLPPSKPKKEKLSAGEKMRRAKERAAADPDTRPVHAKPKRGEQLELKLGKKVHDPRPQKANGAPKPKRGSGARIRELLQKGWADEKILATIHREFPESRAQKSDVNWNRRKLRQEGEAA